MTHTGGSDATEGLTRKDLDMVVALKATQSRRKDKLVNNALCFGVLSALWRQEVICKHMRG